MSITCSNAKRGSSRKVSTSGSSASRSAWATGSPFSTKHARTPGRVATVSARSATEDRPGAADLLLKLHDAVNQGLCCRRAAGHIDVHRHDAIATPHHRITVVIVAATVGAASHADHPARFRHLVVNLAECRRHLVGQRAGDDHHVRLAWRGARDDAKAIKVITWHIGMDHLDRAACQPKRHRPQAAGARPVHDLVHVGDDKALVGDLAGDALHNGILLRTWCQPTAVPGYGIAHAVTPNSAARSALSSAHSRGQPYERQSRYSQSKAPLHHS